jgi:hypothetical protein
VGAYLASRERRKIISTALFNFDDRLDDLFKAG